MKFYKKYKGSIMDNITFTGNFISHINIKRVKPINITQKISVIEADPLNFHDLEALREVNDLWQGNFSNNIYKDANAINNIAIKDEKIKFFILTHQKNNFNNLNAEDIIAEGKIILKHPKENSIYLDYLQVQPDNMFESENRIYKGIGTAFLDFIKDLYKGKEISLHSLYSTLDFYMKNGFRPIERNSNNLYFTV